MSIIVFPGQGSQFVGMGKKLLDVPGVLRMFELAGDILKVNLQSLCLNGPKSELDKTRNCQAAVFVTSLAAVEHLKQTNPSAVADCYATAGFSVGEYASLVLADSLSFTDALRIIKVRSEAMQEASEAIPSGLMSTFVNKNSQLNLAMLAARKWCIEKLHMSPENVECSIANYLFAKCKVVGGNKEALDFIELNFKEFKIDRVKHLPVSGAFHTRLMKPAEKDLAEILKQTEFKSPKIKYYSNYDGKSHHMPAIIRKNLIRQVSNPVRWEQILNYLYYDKNLPLADLTNAHKSINNVADIQSPSLSSPDGEESVSSLLPKPPKKQTEDRIYPDIYECGPANQTGPILRLINHKAHKYFKHIDT